ncbi:Transcription factor bHLH104 [Linum perenne]
MNPHARGHVVVIHVVGQEPKHVAEKNELREEKFTLKADKVKIEQQVKAMSVPPSSGFMQPHPATYHAGSTKMPMYPTYNLEPLWQYLPPTVYETSRDHELRPPAT